ncbi:site-specific integrase [Methanolobus sp. ZRKC4]
MQRFYAVVSPAEQTWKNYITAMSHYTDYTQQTPTELIQEAQDDIRAGKLMTERQIFVKLPRFRQYLENVKSTRCSLPLAPGSIEKYIASIATFYKYFYIDTPHSQRKAKTKPLKEHMKRASKEDIRKALDHASIRNRAIILCGLSSGMGAAEISSLTLKSFYEGYDENTGITTFDMRRKKVATDFITFISPEASEAILKYLEWRDRPIINDNRHEYLRRRTTPDSYLFVSANVSRKYFDDFNEECRRLTSKAILSIYARVSDDSGLSTGTGCYNTLRSHNMRKYFNTTLKNEGCDSDIVEYFMGHTLGDTKAAYYEGDPEKLKKIYEKFVAHLTISKELDLSDSPEYQKAIQENEILSKVNAQNVVKLDEMGTMQQQLNKLQQEFSEVMRVNAKHPTLTSLYVEEEENEIT